MTPDLTNLPINFGFLTQQSNEAMNSWNMINSINSVQPLSARGQKVPKPLTELNQITNAAIRKMHQTTDKFLQKLNIAETLPRRVAQSLNNRQANNTIDNPYSFSKNVLNRDQLNEIINMKEAKKLAVKKRGSTQIEPQ